MGGTFSLLLKLGCFTALMLVVMPSYAALAPKTAAPLKMTPHYLFQNVYSQAVTQPQQNYNNSKIKKTINQLRAMANVSLGNTIKLKVSKIKSGPLSHDLTEMVKVAPGIQTNEGRVSESSDGYGIKFSLKF